MKIYPIGYKIGDLLSDYTRSDINLGNKKFVIFIGIWITKSNFSSHLDIRMNI